MIMSSCLKNGLKKIYKAVATPFYQMECTIAKKFAAHAYERLFFCEWRLLGNPEQFDHDIDLYYQWPATNNPHWLERGVYNLLAIKQFAHPALIELCCGEGFNSTRFYATSCDQVWACDFDPAAIKQARRKYGFPNVTFEVADIRDGIPATIGATTPTNVIWDTAIEHFTPAEIDAIMQRIHEVLTPTQGILSGHTITKNGDRKGIEQHEYEFENMDDLKRFFTPYFKNVMVWETVYKDRHNLYFMASDGVLPFSKDWEHWR